MAEVQVGADLGATNARWFLIQNGKIVDTDFHKVHEHDTVLDSLGTFLKDNLKDRTITAAAIDAPGPPLYRDDGLRITFTNPPQTPDGRIKSPWVVDQSQIASYLGIPKENTVILNDYQAVVLAIDVLNPVTDFEWLTEIRPAPMQPMLAVGPGTGLGIGRGKLTVNGLDTSPSEGPHDIFAAVGRLQREIVGHVREFTDVDSPSNEDMVCFSRGLPNLHGALRRMVGETVTLDRLLPNEQIIMAAQKDDDLAIWAIDHQVRMIGNITGRKAIDPICLGGVYLLGLEKLGPLLDDGRKELLLRSMRMHTKAELLDEVPVALVTADTPAFKGLQRALQVRGLSAATNG